jgi:hypothetical protein
MGFPQHKRSSRVNAACCHLPDGRARACLPAVLGPMGNRSTLDRQRCLCPRQTARPALSTAAKPMCSRNRDHKCNPKRARTRVRALTGGRQV